MPPIPTEWWFRPVSSAWRVGEQSAVVWKRLYLSPFAASRSAVGVEHGPPKALEAPKPAVVDQDDRTFGAPPGGRSGSIGGNEVAGSFASYVTSPGYGASGIGRTCRWISSRSAIDAAPLAALVGEPMLRPPNGHRGRNRSWQAGRDAGAWGADSPCRRQPRRTPWRSRGTGSTPPWGRATGSPAPSTSTPSPRRPRGHVSRRAASTSRRARGRRGTPTRTGRRSTSSRASASPSGAAARSR